MVCFRVYNSPACCGTGITDGGDATAVNSRCHCRRSSKRTVTCTSPPISYNCFRSITRSFIEPNSRFGDEINRCFSCTYFCNRITAFAPANNFRYCYLPAFCNYMKTARKFPAPTGCREYLILIQLFIFGYILSDYRAIGCDNLRPSPGVWPATSSYCIWPKTRNSLSAIPPIRSGHKNDWSRP